jgi:hypothetical protein
VDVRLAELEASGLSAEEEAVAAKALRTISLRQREALSLRDLVQVVRGYVMVP